MTVASVRTRPLIAVISRVPLFVEALRAAFEGIADLQSVSADDAEANGLVRAFRPDAVIVEGADADGVSIGVPCVRVQIEGRSVAVRHGGEWLAVDVELVPEAIRNVAIAEIYGGDPS